MEKRALFILFIAGLMLTSGAVLAQEGGAQLEDPYAEEEPPAGEGDEAAEGEKKAADEAPPAEGEEKAEEGAEEKAEEEPAAEEAPAAGEEKAEEAAPAAAEAPAETEETAAEAAAEDDEEDDEEGDEEGDEEDKDEEKRFRRTFAGTSIYWKNAFTARSLNKNYDYTWLPVYNMGFGLSPKWNVTDDFSLSTNIGFTVELTNTKRSNKKNEVYFGDIPIHASYRYKVDINDDVKFGTGLNGGFLFPTSKMSRYTTLYTSLSLGTNATFIFPEVLEGLSIGWAPSFSKHFHASENPHPDENPLDASAIPDSEKKTSDHYAMLTISGFENPSWSISNGLSLSLGIWETLAFSFGYTHTYVYMYSATNTATEEPLDCTIDPMGCDPARDTGYNERGIYIQAFSYMFSYTLPDPAHMIGLSLGAVTASPQVALDGQYEKPFFNRHTMINFGVTLDLDTMINAIQGGDESEEERKERATRERLEE